jgi:phage regulator Rha-like protein
MELQILQQKIFTIRGNKVMLDFDLAQLYEVETRVLKQSIRRNSYRFPNDFMFELTKNEWNKVITNCDNLPENIKYSPIPPFAFTEQGVAMLSSVLKSKKAVEINIAIMRAFVEIRNMLSSKNELSQQLKDLKQELEVRLGEQDTQIIEIYDVLDQLMEQKHQVNTPQERTKIGFKK